MGSFQKLDPSNEGDVSLLESMGGAVIVTDLEGRISFWNREAERLCGRSREDVMGRAILDLQPATESGGLAAAAIMDSLRASEPWSGTFQVRHEDGSTLWLHAMTTPLLDPSGSPRGMIGISRTAPDEEEVEQRERRLRESEERLRLALEAGGFGTWEWNVATGEIRWSGGRHGIEPEAFSGNIDEFRAALHRDDEERVIRGVGAALSNTDSEYGLQYRIHRQDGEIRWLETRGRIERDTEGTAVRMLGVCSDITDRKHDEANARFLAEAGRVFGYRLDPEEALRKVAALAVPEMADCCTVFLLDEEGKLDVLDLTHQDPTEREALLEVQRRHPPEPEFQHGVQAAIRSGKPGLLPKITPELLKAAARDSDHLAGLERLRFRSSLIVPLTAGDERLGAVTFSSTDSGRRYREADLEVAEKLAARAALAVDNARLFEEAEEARLEAQRAATRLELLAEVSDLLASTLEPDEAMQDLASLAIERVTDYCVTYYLEPDGSVRRVAGAHRIPEKQGWVEKLLRLDPPDLADKQGAGAVIRTGEPELISGIPEGAYEGAGWDENRLRIVQALHPLSRMIVPLSARGRMIGAIGFATTPDSGRRHDTDDLALALELASRAALALDNLHLYEEAREAVRVRQELMEVLSHDLRDPLHTISMLISILEEGDTDLARRQKHFAILDRTIHRMVALIEDLLDVSRLEGGQLRLEPSTFDLVTLLRDVEEGHSATAEAKGIRFIVHRPEDAQLRADRARVMQVFSNLLSNAVRFTPAGGQVTIRTGTMGDTVVFTVEDTGPGIADSDLPHLFERFWQAERRYGGSGLGLAIAAGVVEAHGGEIWAESELGEGTRVHFTLPASPALNRPPPSTSRRRGSWWSAPPRNRT